MPERPSAASVPPAPYPSAAEEGVQGRAVELSGYGVPLSGLIALPGRTAPRAVVVALHGGGMRAGYFHGRADPGASLLTLAARHGYAALALDRPGYGRSAERVPHGMGLAEQAAVVRGALAGYRRSHPCGAGFFLVGHSLGGKVALTTAAGWRKGGLLGVDVSGISDRWAVSPTRLTGPGARGTHGLHWGPLALYPPRTFELAAPLIAPLPRREAEEAPYWPSTFAAIAPRIRVPVRFTFAEHERWWRCDARTVREMTARLASPLVRTERLEGAGHNISLGNAARTYHHRVLDFLAMCHRPPRAAPA
ncbi:alpha/beta hydrolase [Streptomyces sp. QL37]|uniref:alpha/beta hydrolase n=1 Tax=Streptomyces sp. QL37 TaxID=2093747 RepID=UPI000CF24EC8|nr:alpha/beta fold hydrolase [Streptomyces sp. QL37]PPQ57502.1 alpha/beta hydrolase [Streptomyces sp. QL37]